MKRLLTLLLLIPNIAWGANWYARPSTVCANNGDGTAYACASTPGGAGAFNRLPDSSATYWGGSKMVAGGTLYLDGTFVLGAASDRLVLNANTFTITSYDIANPATIDGANTYGDLIDNTYGPRSGTVDHINLKNCGVNDCIITSASTTFTVQYCDLAGGTKYGIYCYACSNNVFRYNTVHGFGQIGIYLANPTNNLQSSGVTVDHNTVYDNVTAGIRTAGKLTNASCDGDPAGTPCVVDTTNGKGWLLTPTITNNTTYRNGSGIYLVATRGALVQGNVSFSNSGGENYGLAGEICDQCVWKGNEAYSNAGKALEVWANDAGTQTGVQVIGNYFHDNNTSHFASACNFDLNHGPGANTASGSNILVAGNVLSGGCGILIHDAYTGVIVANNTVVHTDQTYALLGGIFLSTNSTGTLQNNIVQADQTYALLGSNTGSIGAWTHDHNDYYAPNSATPIRVNSTNYAAATSWEASAITSNPLFISDNDFRLTPTSPAIGAGTCYLSVGCVYPDFKNHVQHGKPNIGAYGSYVPLNRDTVVR